VNVPPPATPSAGGRYDAVVFDLLTALLDSWSLWNTIAGSAEAGMRWRREYLRLTYGQGAYRDYEELVTSSAVSSGLPATLGAELVRRWDEVEPWPEVGEVLGALRGRVRLAVVTNCSDALGARAVARTGVAFDVTVTAQRAGWYKPSPRPYEMALDELGVAPSRALFVAGSPNDLPGASGVGMDVFWHNRLGLPLSAGGAGVEGRYVGSAASLRPVVQLATRVDRSRSFTPP
jgi:2-haloalkanoic acid dehalogenase type II